MSIIQGTSKGSGAGYEIDQSIRFNDDDAAYLYRDNNSAQTDTKKFTYSLWIKRGAITGGTNTGLLSGGSGTTSGRTDFLFTAGSATGDSSNHDALKFDIYTGGWTQRRATAKLRDPGGWYHIVLVYDAANSTANDTLIMYLNSTRLELDSTSGVPNNLSLVNANGQRTKVGADASGTPVEYDGLISDIMMIDGQALAPTAFAETSTSGVWVPKAYDGSYGTNGFYITGADSTALGADVRISGDQVISYAASQYTGATGSYTYSNGSLEADSDNKAIKTVDTFAGDFEFSWRYVNMANFVIGVYETGEDGTFSDSSSAGNMQNMTDSWYIQTSSVAANRDIFYGGAVQVNATTIANGDTWKMTRSSGTIKLIRNGSDVHTFSQTSTNTVRIVVAQGDAAADAEQVAWVDNSTLGNNFFSTGMTTADKMLDTPTLNWCTWNNIDTSFNNNVTSDGNLVITTASPGYTRFQLGTIGVSSGKWEWKWTPTASLSDGGIGVDDGTSQAATGASSGAISSQSANGFIYRSGGTKCVGGTASSYGATFAADDVIRCQIDLDAGTPTIEFFKNDASQGSINMNAGVTYFPCQFSADASLVTVVDFGQVSFTAAAGFNLLNTANLATPTISDGSKYFQPTLYEGNGSTQSINQAGNSTFQPDFAWIKNRDAADAHALFDAVRGATKVISSNATTAEDTNADTLTAFESDGFALGDDVIVNTNNESYVAWQWLAGNSSGSTNDDGSVDSTVTANTTAGFSVVKYTPGTGAQTWGHGLGVAPKMVIVKEIGQAVNWQVYHEGSGAGGKIFLNTTAAYAADTGIWNNTAPTSSLVSTGSGINTANPFIAYCFAEIPGYSSIDSYTGNGSANGPMIFTNGMKPAFIIVKRAVGGTGNWGMFDIKRDPINPADAVLDADSNGAEASYSTIDIDFLSNGFKVRGTQSNINASGSTYIYMAFGSPIGGDGVAPATAR